MSSLSLNCLVTSSDHLPFKVSSYKWNTEECYKNSGYQSGIPGCFPHQHPDAEIVYGTDLTAEDAGIISCTVTINNKKYTSDSITIHISGKVNIALQ